MRLALAAAMLCCFCSAIPAQGEQNFPYKAFVTADDTYVRSGPGQSYYPTEKLKAGQEVEVYRHDPGGWYAIRPPQGSFCWISGRYLEMKDNNLAAITDEQVAARVGSRFSEIRDVIQVRLHRGEVVEVLESKPPAGRGGATWYKITPPSGEFRWVFGKYVDAGYPVAGVRKVSLGQEAGASATAAAAAASTPASSVPAPPAVPEAQPEVREQPAFAPVTERRLSAGEFQKQLDEIDTEVAIMVAEEPTVWKFDQLSLRARSLLAQAETAVERGRARVLVSKISRFEDLKQRSDNVNSLREETDRTNRQLAAAGTRPAVGSVQADPNYDGTGKLTRVVSPKVGAPRYALIDKSGSVQYYVSPAPGIDLRHYVGREVGISGVRGYMPEQRTQHLMAKHVTALDGTVLR